MIPDPFIRFQASADALEEGYFLLQRRRARRVDMPVRIWFGAPVDPENPDATLDRSPRWQIMIAGVMIDQPDRLGGLSIDSLADIWPACRNDIIDREDYEFRMASQNWAAINDPDDARATPGGRIDPLTTRLPAQHGVD